MKNKLRRGIRNSIDGVILAGLVGVLSGPFIGSRAANWWIHQWDTELRELKCSKYDGIHIHANDESKIDYVKLDDILKSKESEGDYVRINAMTNSDKSRMDNAVLNLMMLKYFYPEYYEIVKNIKTIRILDDFESNVIGYIDSLGIMKVKDMYKGGNLDWLVYMGLRFKLYEEVLEKTPSGRFDLLRFYGLRRDEINEIIEDQCHNKQMEFREKIHPGV